jgi:protein TonB
VSVRAGPRIFHAAVRNAMLAYQCSSGEGEIVATQDFSFKVD